MTVVNCPYCNESQEINHDGGYGYDEGQEHEQDCISCGNDFKFYTSISFDYQVLCSNGHDMEDQEYKGLWSCTRCDHHEHRP